MLEGAREAIEGVVSQVFQARRGKTPRNNQAQNGQFEDAVKQIEKRIGRKLKNDEIRRLYKAISGQGYDFHEIVSIGVDMFGNPEHQLENDEYYDD
jgi:N12 class adenine-specific DNA methylase